MNWVDIIVIAFVIYFLVMGYFQGFLRQTIDLVGLVLSFLFAVKFYPNVTGVIESFVSIPASFAGVIGFFVAWFIFRLLYFFASSFLYKVIPERVKNSKYNRFGGGAPALLRGVVLSAILLTLCLILPIPVQAKDQINNSKIGGSLVKHSANIEAYLEKQFGGAINETLTFLTTKSESGTDETTDLGFKSTKLSVDKFSEEKMLELVNQERTSRGLRALVMDEKLREVARKHSKDMFEKGYFSHTNKEGKSPFDRMHDDGVTFLVAGENLALAPNVDIAHNGLMNSPGHKANILTSDFGKVGIGVIDGGIYGKMFSQEFTD